MTSTQASLDESLFEQASDTQSLATFTSRLKTRLRANTAATLPGLTLATSLEILMKMGRHKLDTIPAASSGIDDAVAGGDEPGVALARARHLCDVTISLAVWLRNHSAPTWTYRHLGALQAFRTLADLAHRAGESRLALHWSVALVLLPTTPLGAALNTKSALQGHDLDRFVRLQQALGPQAVKDEIEAWHDLFLSYRLVA